MKVGHGLGSGVKMVQREEEKRVDFNKVYGVRRWAISSIMCD